MGTSLYIRLSKWSLLPKPLGDGRFFLTNGAAVDLHHVARGPAGPALDHVFRGTQLLVLNDEAVAQSLGGGLDALDSSSGHDGADRPPAGGAAKGPNLLPGLGRAAAALKVADLVHVVNLGEEGGRQRHEPVDALAALQGFEDHPAGTVVDIVMGDGQPLAEPATGVVEQQGEGALLPVVRFGQGAVDSGEEVPPLVGGQVNWGAFKLTSTSTISINLVDRLSH